MRKVNIFTQLLLVLVIQNFLPFHAPDLSHSAVGPEDQILCGQKRKGGGLPHAGGGHKQTRVVARAVRGQALHAVLGHVEQNLRHGHALGGVELAHVVADAAHASDLSCNIHGNSYCEQNYARFNLKGNTSLEIFLYEIHFRVQMLQAEITE
jgi:hypothetical protein